LNLRPDPEFESLLSDNTSGKTRVESRFEMWKEMLDEVMVGSEQGPRLFPRAVKDQLWSEGHTCAWCQQEIQDFDDAHVDHKVPYSKGGKTEKDNGQLMHRYCNQVKSATEQVASQGLAAAQPADEADLAV